MERRRLRVEVEPEVRRARISVSRLPDRARVEQDATTRLDRRARAREAAAEDVVDPGDLECDVAVPDEHEGARAQRQRGRGRFVGEDVLPDGGARTAVIERDLGALALRLQAREERRGR